MMLNGVCWELPMSEPPISGKGGGLWPSPRVCDNEGGPTRDAKFDGKSWYRENKKGVRWGVKLKDAVAVSQTWPTPRAQDGPHGPARDSFGDKVRWPTPASRDYRNPHAKDSIAFQQRQENPRGVNLVEEMQRRQEGIGGQLNPDWVEWLMGWPIGWTDLKPLAMDKFQEWLRLHGKC